MQVSRVEDATAVKVVPTQNNGSTELVTITRQKVRTGQRDLCTSFLLHDKQVCPFVSGVLMLLQETWP